jgi:hypothetical protein
MVGCFEGDGDGKGVFSMVVGFNLRARDTTRAPA